MSAERWKTAGVGAAVGALGGYIARDLDLLNLLSLSGDRTPMVLVAALFGAVVWGTRLRRALAVGLLVGVSLWSIVALTPLSAWLIRDLPRRDPAASADAVFVLSSGIQPDGELTTVAMDRLVHALELVGQGHTSRLILSELWPPRGSYAAQARPLMAHLGLKPDLFTVGPVRNTHDEAVAVGALCRARGWTRLLVVTSPLHSRRACAALEHEQLVTLSSPAVETRYDLETLDRLGARLFAFGDVLHERIGLFVYRRRGWISGP
jgi:uncharacterized SAM-binding protein YcdF (DUF218 family)